MVLKQLFVEVKLNRNASLAIQCVVFLAHLDVGQLHFIVKMFSVVAIMLYSILSASKIVTSSSFASSFTDM